MTQAPLSCPDGWERNEQQQTITRRYRFANYRESFLFVTHVSLLAERADHHPDITFGWGYVHITLTTHDTTSVTEKDINLAISIDKNYPMR